MGTMIEFVDPLASCVVSFDTPDFLKSLDGHGAIRGARVVHLHDRAYGGCIHTVALYALASDSNTLLACRR